MRLLILRKAGVCLKALILPYLKLGGGVGDLHIDAAINSARSTSLFIHAHTYQGRKGGYQKLVDVSSI